MAESEQQEQTLNAAEYVLGTLDAQASSRFETSLMHDPQARADLAYWEERLGALGLGLEPVEPPADVWRRVTEGLGLRAAHRATAGGPDAATPAPAANDSAYSLWRGLAVAASVAAIAMAAVLFGGLDGRDASSGNAPEPAYASVVYDEPTGMSWLVTAHENSDKMQIVSMGDYDVPEGKVLRLWFKADNGDPVLLGKWPHTRGTREMTMPDAMAQSMDRPAQLMVSMEDAGSSTRTGEPSGKLMWQSRIARRTG